MQRVFFVISVSTFWVGVFMAWWNDSVLFDRSFQVTDFIDLAIGSGAGSEKQKTVILGESFGAMLGIRLGQLR